MNGIELYRGASALDGKPIVAIATGLAAGSRNAKTGGMVQTWIMRADIAPTDAAHSGDDSSICGACPHKGRVEDGKNVARSCYVVLFQAPTSIYKAWQRGGYAAPSLADSAALLAGRHIRLGAYGDPAALPYDVWESLLGDKPRVTGYTHQWETCDSRFANLCMASADSLEQANRAQAKGYRTFRIGTHSESLVKGEFLCPASAEAGKVLSCDSCMACGGHNSPNKSSVFIYAHGRGAKNFAGQVAA